MSVAAPAIRPARRSRMRAVLPGLLAVFLVVLVLPLAIIAGDDGNDDDFGSGGLPSGARPFLVIYQDAAKAFDVSPFLLMAVHEDETSFSTAPLPGVTDGVNFAGCCAGPMQFSITGSASPALGGTGGTWAAYANAYKKASTARPASYPARFTAHTPNVYDSFDAIYAAAGYFHGLGAGPRLDQRTLDALASYKGTPPASLPYARHDYQRALELQRLAAAATGPTASAGLGDVAGSPLQKVIAYANRIESLHLPYCWGGGHQATVGPSPGISYCHTVGHGTVFDTSTRGLDCSGSVRWLLALAGFRDPGGISSGDFSTAYDRGPGRHVTIWSNADHVFVTVDGRGWGTSAFNYRNGPGWADHTTVGYTPSHPHGL